MSDFGTDGELVPDLPEPIRGYRAWSHDGTRLLGMGGIIWPAGEPLQARCQTTIGPVGAPAYHQSVPPTEFAPGDVPVHACPSPDAENHSGYGCGVYAYKDANRVRGYEGYEIAETGQVFGCVELGGKVYEHSAGYRAEYAMPVAFYGDETDEGLAHIAAVYEVPVERPPWLMPADPDAARARVNEDARKQAEAWDEAASRAAPSIPQNLYASLTIGRPALLPTDPKPEGGQKYPNAAGYSDARVEEITRCYSASLDRGIDYAAKITVSCIASNPGHGRYVASKLKRRDRYVHPETTKRKVGWVFWVNAAVLAANLIVGVSQLSNGRPPYNFLTALIPTFFMVREWRRG